MSSWLWNHFTPLDTNEATCNHCDMRYNIRSTTSSLRYHIKHHHNNDVAELDEASNLGATVSTSSNFPTKKSRISTSSDNDELSTKQRKRSTPRNHPKTEIITKALVKMVAVDMLPLSFVDGPGFQQFMAILSPEYTIPSRPTVRNRLEQLYESVKSKLMAAITNYHYVSLTTDAWSSRATNSYVTVTLHGIDKNWNMISYTLDTLEFEHRHTGENLRKHLLQVSTEWNIGNKVVSVVHDNASNIVAAMETTLELGESVRCFCHSLQLAVNHSIKHQTSQDFLQKASNIVCHFKHSNVASKVLHKKQNMLGLPEHQLQNRCPTRWNSTFQMAERLVEQKQAIDAVFDDRDWTSVKVSKQLKLDDDGWRFLRDLVNLLRPFDVATNVMSTESNSTIAMVRPLVFRIVNKFLGDDSTDTEAIEMIKTILKAEVETRFHSNHDVDFIDLACILDPRYKNMPHVTPEYFGKVIERLKMAMRDDRDEDVLATSTQAKKDRRTRELDFLFDDTGNHSQEFVRTASFMDTEYERELQKYRAEPTIQYNDDPLQWWNSHARLFPTLARLAKKFLCTPSSSTPSERVFSTAGNIISAKRSSLAPQNANLLIFLYKNRQILEELMT